MSLENKILSVVARLFIRIGFRSLSMDEIARELGISKKTLYQFFPAKETLVKAVVKAHIEEEKRIHAEIIARNLNAIEEVVEMYVKLCRETQGISAASVYELKKYFPEAWDLFTDYKNDFIYNHVLSNLKAGIRQGVYRKQIKPEIIARIYVTAIDRIIDPDLFDDQVSIPELYEQFLIYHLHGIVTEEGLKYLDSKTISKKFKL